MNTNRTGVGNIVRAVMVVGVVGVIGYFALSNQQEAVAPSNGSLVATETPADWQVVDANAFTLSLPPGWKLNPLQGIDSYIGEIVGNGATLGFDYGWYSNPLAEDTDPTHVVTYETVGGQQAKIVVPKITGNGTTGVYFADIGNDASLARFQISGEDLTASQQQTALTIFRTLQFKK